MGLGILGVTAIVSLGVWLWKGATLYNLIYSITPKPVMTLVAKMPISYFHHVDVIKVVDHDSALTWVLEVINNSTARVLVSPFTSPDQIILASTYFSNLSNIPHNQGQ